MTAGGLKTTEVHFAPGANAIYTGVLSPVYDDSSTTWLTYGQVYYRIEECLRPDEVAAHSKRVW